jgi:peptide/nickel transport system substrate-binding protein
VPIQHVSFKFYSDEKSEALAMRAGEVNIAFPQDGRTFGTTSASKIVSYPFNAIGYFGMNTQLAPWNDVHVRRAVAYALNRTDVIAANGGPGSATPAYAAIPTFELRPLGSQSQIDSLVNSLPQYRFDLAKARQEMAQSAYPHGFAASVDTRSDYVAWSNILQVISAQLGQIGITLAVHAIPVAKWTAEISGPKTYGPMFSTLYAVPPDPSLHANYLFGSENGAPAGYNFASYSSPALDDLLNAGLATSDPSKRLGIYGQLLKKAATDVPYVPLYQENAYTALSSNFTLPPLNIWPGFVPWALDIKKTA